MQMSGFEDIVERLDFEWVMDNDEDSKRLGTQIYVLSSLKGNDGATTPLIYRERDEEGREYSKKEARERRRDIGIYVSKKKVAEILDNLTEKGFIEKERSRPNKYEIREKGEELLVEYERLVGFRIGMFQLKYLEAMESLTNLWNVLENVDSWKEDTGEMDEETKTFVQKYTEGRGDKPVPKIAGKVVREISFFEEMKSEVMYDIGKLKEEFGNYVEEESEFEDVEEFKEKMDDVRFDGIKVVGGLELTREQLAQMVMLDDDRTEELLKLQDELIMETIEEKEASDRWDAEYNE